MLCVQVVVVCECFCAWRVELHCGWWVSCACSGVFFDHNTREAPDMCKAHCKAILAVAQQ